MKKYIFLALFVILQISCSGDGESFTTVTPEADPALAADEAAAAAAAQAAADAAAASAAQTAAYCADTATFYEDADGDGFGSTTTKEFTACEFTTGYTDNSDDCDDADASINPDARDALGDSVDANCDGEDADCSRLATFYPDGDGDGFGTDFRGAPTQELSICTTPDDLLAAELSRNHTDCDDRDPLQHPGAPDPIGNGVDTNCKTEKALSKYVVVTDRGPAGGPKMAETYTIFHNKVVRLKKDLNGDGTPDIVKSYEYDASGNLTSVEVADVAATTYSADFYLEFDTVAGNPVVKVHASTLNSDFSDNSGISTYSGDIYTYSYDANNRVTSLLTDGYDCMTTDARAYTSAAIIAGCAAGMSTTNAYTYTLNADGTELAAKTVDLLSDGLDHDLTFEYNDFGDLSLKCDAVDFSCSGFKYSKGPAYVLNHNEFKDSISLVRHQGRIKSEIIIDNSTGTDVVTGIKHNFYDEEGALVRSYIDNDHDGIGAADADNILQDAFVVVGIPTYVEVE